MASEKTENIGKSIETSLKGMIPSNYGINRSAIEYEVNKAKSISDADWSGVDSKIGTLNGLADAFMAQYANGSDIARAQNTQAAAAFARNAARSQASFAQLQNQGEQLVQQATQNTAQGTQANLQQGNSAGQASQHAEIQKIASDMQRTFANMEIARTKTQILQQAALADRTGIQAATALQNDTRNSKNRVDLGIQEQDFKNTLNAIKLIGGTVATAGAIGSDLAKKKTPDFVSASKSTPSTLPVLTTPGSDSASAGYTAPHSVFTNSRYETGT